MGCEKRAAGSPGSYGQMSELHQSFVGGGPWKSLVTLGRTGAPVLPEGPFSPPGNPTSSAPAPTVSRSTPANARPLSTLGAPAHAAARSAAARTRALVTGCSIPCAAPGSPRAPARPGDG